MEVAQMLAAHSILVKVFLGFLVGGLLIPLMTSKNPLGFRKSSFIYTMIFQAIATMIAFAGLVAIFTGDLGWSVTTIIMVAVWAIMMYIEIKKYKAIKLANIQNADTHKVLKSAFIKISIVQILLVAIMVVLMILKAKGIVSI
jgi:ABC-type transport system involved in Fe-S cluster assembly fused permease/ATPase subunit